MSKIRNFFYKIYLNDYFPFLLLIIFFTLFNMFIKLDTADDVWFKDVLDNTDKFSFLLLRWYNWSSRLIIEYFLVTLVQLKILWRTLNILMYALMVYSIKKLFSLKNKKRVNLFLSFLILLLPVELYNSAGWVATTLNYFWPLVLGLFSLIPIRMILNDEKIVWYKYILYFLASIYALNQEQSCIILFITYFIFFIYIYMKKKVLNTFVLFQFIVSLIVLLLILLCPGNYLRKISEVNTWFPDFNDIPFLRKLEMGFSSSLFEFVFKPNFLFITFCILLVLCICLKFKNIYYRIISLFPLTSSLIFGFFYPILSESFEGIKIIKNSMTPYGTGVTIFSLKSFVPDIILIFTCLSIILSLYKIFDNKKCFALSVFILFLGFISRMIMAFSPTIWVSGTRTYIFMYFSFLICSLILFKEVYVLYTRKCSFVLLLQIFAYLSVINFIYY